MIHPNSLLAFWQGQEGLFGKRAQLILSVLQNAACIFNGLTDREIMMHLGKSDPNYVRPRCTELLKAGVLEEVGSRADPITGKTVRILRLRADPRRPQRQFSFSDMAMGGDDGSP